MIAPERRRPAMIALAALAIAGCRAGQAPPGAPPTPAASATFVPTATPAAAPSPADSLARYVGKYPFDAVDGVRFLDDPIVVGAVKGLVADPAIRRPVLAGDGPGTPIARKDRMLLAWGCETHNCGAHNWTILIAPDGSDARLCYHDAATMADRARWYLAPGRTEMRDGGCPSE